MVSAKTRQFVSWTLAILVHVALLLSLNTMILAGERPALAPHYDLAVTLQTGRAAPGNPDAPTPATPPNPAPAPPPPHPRHHPHRHRPHHKAPTPTPTRAPATTPPSPTRGGSHQSSLPDTTRMARTASPGSRAPGGGGDARNAGADGNHDKVMNRYLARVRDTIEDHKVYPAQARLRGQQGEVEIRFRIDRHGHTRKVTLAHGSHSDVLNRESMNLVRNLSLPAPPEALLGDTPIAVTIPIRYRL